MCKGKRALITGATNGIGVAGGARPFEIGR